MATSIIRRLFLLFPIGLCLLVTSFASPVALNTREPSGVPAVTLNGLFENKPGVIRYQEAGIEFDFEGEGPLERIATDRGHVARWSFRLLPREEIILLYDDMNHHSTVIVGLTSRGPVLVQVSNGDMSLAEHQPNFELLETTLFGSKGHFSRAMDQQAAIDPKVDDLQTYFAAVFSPENPEPCDEKYKFPKTVAKLKSSLKILFEDADGKGDYTEDQITDIPTPHDLDSIGTRKQAYGVYRKSSEREGQLEFFAGPHSTEVPIFKKTLKFDEKKNIWVE